jgi:CHAT domain-containing protein/Tfp pilus assembly protein PilF
MKILVVVLLLHSCPLFAQTEELWLQLYQQAADLQRAGKYPDAIAQHEKSLAAAEQVSDKIGVAKNLIAIGRIRTKLGEYALALKLIQQGKELAEQQKNRTILVSALVAISDLDERQSRFQEALQSAEKALQIAQELNDDQSISTAYRYVGHCYYSQGQFKIALQNYKESLKYAEKINNPSEISHSLLATGVAVLDTGDYENGIPYLLSALEKAEQAGEKAMLAGILSETGIAYKEMGMFEESAEYYNRGLRIAEELGQKETKARILNNLGVLYANEGRNDEAIHHYQQSLKIAEELKNLRGIALLLNNIGGIFRDEGRYDEAITYFERSLKTREEIGDQWGISSALLNMGTAFQKQKKYDRAIDVYKKSLEISNQTGNKPRVALTLRHLGETHLSKGNYPQAQQNFQEALSLGKEVQSKMMMGYSLEGLGKVSLALQKYPEAAEYFRQALTVGKEVTKPEMVWGANYGLGKVYEKLEQHSQALKCYSDAIDEIEKVRVRASSDEGKSGFFANHLRIYEDMIRLLYKLDQKYPGKNYCVQAFEYSERAKARMFLDTFTEFQSGIRKGLSKQQLRREKAMVQKISKLQSDLWDASEKDQPQKQKKLREAEGEMDQFILDLKLQNPQYAQLKYPEPLGVAQIQKQLDEKSVLIEFFLGEEESFVFAVTSDSKQIGKLGGTKKLEESVRKFMEQIRMPQKTALGSDFKRLQLEYRSQAQDLFQLLIVPVEQHLKDKADLILILDGILHYVPFETLIDNDRLLIERFRVTYAPSVTLLASLQKELKQRNTKGLIAFADPVLSSDPSKISAEQQGSRLQNLIRLRYSKEEVEGIASLYPKDSQQIYLAHDATEEKFRSENISQYEVVHFATHALIDEEVPRRSGIVLTSEAKGQSDGVLQMHEIWNLNLNTKLVVLSACETGLGKLVRGEGMVSLMRAFFYAGTKSIVVSLWNVDDNSTADLMKAFYTHMKNGMSSAESLRQAKLEMIQGAKEGSNYAAYQQAYYWGPFILIGPGN